MTLEQVNRGIPRIGAADQARGRTLFSDDIPLNNPLILRVFRSEKPHARIVDLSVEKAAQLPGVAGVLTAADIPGKNLFGLINKDQPLLAPEKVRFRGEAIALVAAENEQAAQAAMNAIQIRYEELPPIFDPERALDQDAPRIHEKGNLLFKRTIRKGDAAGGLKRSHVVVERRYQTPCLEHTYLEPDAGIGYVDDDGTLVIHASTQNPHYDHAEVSQILGLDPEKVRIIQAATGGGFGSKLDLTVQGFIGLALYHFHRPVRLVYPREESYLATSKRHPFIIRMESGAGRNGKLIAVRVRMICDTGAYASYGIAVATRAAVHVTGPYEVENVEVECACVYTNNPVAGAMRGFGVPQVAVAHESQMDILADELGLDPLEIRKINALRPGALTATGQELTNSVGILKTLDAITPYYRQSREEWVEKRPSSHLKRGIGIGAMYYGIGNTGVKNPSSARIQMDAQGRVTLYTGAADIGQGSTTALTQIASEVLGIEPLDIGLVVADTKWTANAGATSASRHTYISGNAVKAAAENLADILLTEAAERLGTPKAVLFLKEGFVVDSKNPGRSVPFSELAEKALLRGRELNCQGFFDPATTPLDPDTGQGNPYATYAFACHLAFITVDTRTGEVSVSKIVAAHDVGKAINPLYVEGQIHGGVAMGIGFALMEEYITGSTASMADYHIPTAKDMPKIVSVIVEDPEPTGPFGAKGVGEPALIPTAPAVINAIANALGRRIYTLPAKPERVRGLGI